MKKIENNQLGQERFQFDATLVSMGTTTRQNTNGKIYKLCTIDFEVNGTTHRAGAAIYESNYNHGVEVGKKYLSTATIVGEVAYIQMSHLPAGATLAAASIFLAEAAKEAPVATTVREVVS